jgi:hypothetical protein
MTTKMGPEDFALLRTIYDMAHGMEIEPIDPMQAAQKRGIAPDAARRLVGLLRGETMITNAPNGHVYLGIEGAKLVEVARSMSDAESDKQETYPKSQALREWSLRRSTDLRQMAPSEVEAIRRGWAWADREIAKRTPTSLMDAWTGTADDARQLVADLLSDPADPERLTACCFLSAKEVWEDAAHSA